MQPSPSSRPVDPTLQAFRGDSRATPPLHPLEKWLVIVTSLHLCLLPWALGTMHVWSQCLSLALSLAGFVLALIPRSYREDVGINGKFRLIMWPKLVRFPIFWLGLAYLAYVFIQAVNPAYVVMIQGTLRWTEAVPHFAWLPSGVQAPFAEMNAWRVLLIHGSALLLTCSLWVGFTRRTAVQNLLSVVVANGTLFAFIGLIQRGTRTTEILWFIPGRGSFFSTIIYSNHAGAYLNLVYMISTGLMYWYYARSARRMERANPAPIFGFACVVLGISVLLTYSRGATILMMAFTLLAFIGFMIRWAGSRSEGRNPLVLSLLCTVLALFLGLGAYFMKAGKSVDDLQKLAKTGTSDSSYTTRQLARNATWDMARDNPVTGWGAGSFRHYFPHYQKAYPEIYRPGGGHMLRWNYAHNDYVQLVAEIGFAGAALILAMLVAGSRHFLSHRAFLRPHILFLLLALGLTLVHAWFDFVSHNPAVLLLWCATAIVAARWTELEDRRV